MRWKWTAPLALELDAGGFRGMNRHHHMTIRAYTPEDFATVAAWAEARGMVLIPQLLSKNGFLIEDEHGPIAACWVYLMFDCHRASIDDFYARPSANVWAVKKAWKMLERTAIDFLSKLRDCKGDPVRYPVLTTFADSNLAEFLKRSGWHVGTKPHFHILKTISYESS